MSLFCFQDSGVGSMSPDRPFDGKKGHVDELFHMELWGWQILYTMVDDMQMTVLRMNFKDTHVP